MEGPRQLEQHIRKDREDADTGHEHHSLDISPRNQERVPLAERGLGIEVMYRDLRDGRALYCNGGIGAGRAEVHVKPPGYFFCKGLDSLLCMMLHYLYSHFVQLWRSFSLLLAEPQ